MLVELPYVNYNTYTKFLVKPPKLKNKSRDEPMDIQFGFTQRDKNMYIVEPTNIKILPQNI